MQIRKCHLGAIRWRLLWARAHTNGSNEGWNGRLSCLLCIIQVVVTGFLLLPNVCTFFRSFVRLPSASRWFKSYSYEVGGCDDDLQCAYLMKFCHNNFDRSIHLDDGHLFWFGCGRENWFSRMFAEQWQSNFLARLVSLSGARRHFSHYFNTKGFICDGPFVCWPANLIVHFLIASFINFNCFVLMLPAMDHVLDGLSVCTISSMD